jgi:hypothetical protein
MHCAMLAADGTKANLTITLRAGTHPVNGREEPDYHWTITGDEARYPSPGSASYNRDRSDEYPWRDSSTINVSRDSVNYTYRLHYDGEFRSHPATRGHLLVERWHVGAYSIVESAGIGLCTMTQTESAGQ